MNLYGTVLILDKLVDSTLRLRLFGPPYIIVDNESLVEKLPGKAQAMLYYLAAMGEAQRRTILAGLLWGDLPESAARANLRRALVDLRQTLGDYLVIERQLIGFNLERSPWVDVVEFEAQAGQPDPESLQAAIELYRGEFLAGFYVRGAPDFETWLTSERERLRELVIRAFYDLTDHYLDHGQLGAGIATMRRMLSLAPWREEGQRKLMQLLARDGQRAAALAQFETCRRVLEEELRVEPGVETVVLYEQIRDSGLIRQEPARPASYGPGAPAKTIGGRYEIDNLAEDLLGRGRMGQVYRARDRETGDLVAVKVLKPEVVTVAPEMIERLVREGEALRQLNHPNIVKLLAAVEEAGQYYLVMEHVGGGSLRDLLTLRGALPLERVLEIGLGLADALTRAHHLNIVHRDLKPSDVLLAEDGTPRLTDFGIALVASSPRLTRTGVVLGTVDYLSPEGCRGETLGARADIWSFGVLLYEMLTGQRPFSGKSLEATTQAILSQPLPDLAEQRPGLPAGLVALIGRMLQKNLKARLPSVRLVGVELEAMLHGDDYGFQAGLVSEPEIIDSVPRTGILAVRPHNLPPQPGPLIGRDRELAEIDDLLANPECRLLSIVGPGGIGKTRLSLEVAQRYLDRFEAGVYFVSLAALDAPEDIIRRIAFTLRPEMPSHTFSVETFLDDLRQHNPDMLLVLDNLEQLLPDGVGPLQALLNHAPRLRLMTTSREALNLRWEWRFDLAELLYPATGTTADLESYSAVQLFVRLVRRTAFRKPLEGEDLAAAGRICRLLGGIPLGIELAAAQVGKLSCPTIAGALERDLDALADTMRDIPARQRSLRAIFDASWQGLSPDVQRVFRRLSVFRGSFTAKAAQTVTRATPVQLVNLVDKSLLRQTSPDRYEIHPVLCHFAAEKLNEFSEEQADLFERHEAFYAAFLDEQFKRFDSGEAVAAIQAEISAEDENIGAVLRRNVVQGQTSPVAVILDQIQSAAHHLEFFEVRGTTNVHLEHFLKLLEAQANTDYCLIDICWLGITADQLLDLGTTLADQIDQHFPLIIEELTVNERLVALPRSVDLPLLYYRADLLAKYGYPRPPDTWDELEEMAATIQAGERAEGQTEFWGYLWQGHNSETLTCNALEWQTSHGGGQLIESNGTITVNNSRTRAAFERAAGWVGTISPPAVVDFSEPETRAIWEAGQAAFMRMWPIALFSAWFLPKTATAREVLERTSATIMPRAEGGYAATLGGWPAVVVNFARHPEEAIALVRHTTGFEAQLRRALEPFPLPPSIPELYEHAEVRAKHPFLIKVKSLIADGLVIRPSKATGKLYPQVSRAYSATVHSILTGQVDAATAVANLETRLVDLTGFSAGRSS